MTTDQRARLTAVAERAVTALDGQREPGRTAHVLDQLLGLRSLGYASSGGLMVLNADPDGGTVPRTTDVYAHVAGPIDPAVDAGLRDRTHRAMVAVGHHVDAARAEQTLLSLLVGGDGSSATGGLLVAHGAAGDGRHVADVYVHIGGWDEYGQFHLADGTFESPWAHTEDPEGP